MIEATCGACGTAARIAEADVPVGAKFVTCASCKSRVPLPQKAGPPGPPGKPAAKPVAIPPAIPRTPPPIPGKPTVDLADLPAPKRNSPLAGAEPSKPAPRSPLAEAELPAPKGAKSPAPSALDLDDLMGPDVSAAQLKSDIGLADLPAPKPRSSPLADAPPSKPAPSALADLPAPRAKSSALADLPAPKAKPGALADLPAPKKAALDLGDLPAPKKGAAGLTDLPAPKKAGALDLGDLPAPKKGGGGLDLPAPKKGGGTFDDLPAPRGLSLDDDIDLPMPKDGGSDLPMPKPGANNDLVAPKGFFDDLPQPAKQGGSGGKNIDLPAPKGFFDDLPQPATSSSKTVDLAPKGFFDDLPMPAKGDAGAKGGFFDDLPVPAKAASQKPAAGSKPAAAGSVGLFDDLEQPASSAPLGGPDDIGFSTNDIDLGPSTGGSLELDTAGPELDLGLPLGQDQAFTDLDLSEPTTGKRSPDPVEPASPIKIKTPAKGAGPSTPIPISVKKDPADFKLDLAEDPHAGKGGAAAAVATAGGKAPGKRAALSPEAIAELQAKKRKRSRIVLGSVLGIALLGAGGFYFYQRHAAEQAKQDEIAMQLDVARKKLGDADPKHWSRASAAAQKVLELAPSHGPGHGLAAEAALAGALDNGVNYDARVAQGRKLTQEGLGAGKVGPELERAQALMSIAANQPDRAITMLDKQIKASPKDGWLHLYMGWAQLAKGDADAAIKAFDQALATTPNVKLPVLYGLGRAKLLKADIAGARTAFAAVLEPGNAPDHIGAQVGLAATLPPQQSAQREADLLALLAIADPKKHDPRAIVAAWVLVGDVARKAGRLDIARERYNKALGLAKLDLPALIGLAAIELKDGKLQVASDLIQKALAADANHAGALLLAAELEIEEGKLPDAQSKIDKLEARTPPLPPLVRARLHVIKGKWLDKQGKDAEAITEYTAGAKLAGELDLTPTMAAVTKLSALANQEADPAKAAAYRKQADDLLSALAERAKEDGELSLTLGVAYLQAGDAVKAEDSLRRAVALREKDAEAKLQLAKALVVLGRVQQGIDQLKEALSIDPKRGDIALELARTYQDTGRDTEAMATYDKLLADPAVPVIVRANAGRYFASKGARDKAVLQAEPILAVEPENATGLYLKGEGLLLQGKWQEATQPLTKASDIDQSDAQALDALGRAFEGRWRESSDTKYVEAARHAYERATKADPKMFHPQLGLGHMLVEANKWDEAIKPLQVASSIHKSHAEVMYYMGLAFFGVRHQSSAHKKTAADWLEQSLKNQPALTLEQRADAAWRLAQLYVDLNKAGDAARAMENATRLGAEIEKAGGKSPDWLTELYYDLGDMHYKLGSRSGQKRAWQTYVERKPKPGVRLNTANHELGTALKRY